MPSTTVDLHVREVGYSLPVEVVHMSTQPPFERQSKKNNYIPALARAKKDCDKVLARGSLARGSRFFGSTHTIHLLDNVGNLPLPLRPVLDSRISRTTIEIKECVSGEEYALTRKLSKTCNSGFLVESTFQQLQATSIMTLIVVIHREIMSTYVPS